VNIKLTLLGAAKNVTGSSYLLECDSEKYLIDCGLYQERDLKDRNWDPFPVLPKSINGVLLTHAHLDHCGRLPKIVKEGFNGKIYCTAATADIAQIILLDSAKIQEEDAKNKKYRHDKEAKKPKHAEEPLYKITDVHRTLPLFTKINYEKPVQLSDRIKAIFYDAGHILGSSSIKVIVKTSGGERSILFSGDVGRWDIPILKDPAPIDSADYVLVESTYGDREHGKIDTIKNDLATTINETYNSKGNIVIPSFAVERTQELLFYLGELRREKKIPHLMAFVDSPMAINVTEVFRRHMDLFDEDTRKLIESGKHPCEFPGLTMSRAVQQSKAINNIRGTAIIIAGSGMCTGGRIKHHLINNIMRAESTILFVGYQAAGTLGRIILDGAKEVRILGGNYPVQANIKKISGFSAHADRNELLKWLSPIKTNPKKVFIVHGEPESANSFASFVKEKRGWDTVVPDYKQDFVLD